MEPLYRLSFVGDTGETLYSSKIIFNSIEDAVSAGIHEVASGNDASLYIEEIGKSLKKRYAMFIANKKVRKLLKVAENDEQAVANILNGPQ